jgi:glycosyltransferase involved in cell wall biosynthesis
VCAAVSSPRPRVTVGVPTYNRAATLPRALTSVLAQTHADLELLVSDNASTDETPEVCRAFAQDDPRVRVVRRPHNVGLTENFNALLREATGELVMVLADDDWLDPSYVERCVALLDARPDHVVASGVARFHRDGVEVARGVEVDLVDDDPAMRVRRFFADVQDNPAIYGLMRRDALAGALPMQNCLAGDWLLIGRMAMAGKIRTLPEASVNRSTHGTSSSYRGTVRSMGLTAREERHPHVAIASLIYADIARDAPAYARLGARRRRLLGLACALAVLRARPFNVAEDALAPYLRRRRLRRLHDLLRPVARRLQR